MPTSCSILCGTDLSPGAARAADIAAAFARKWNQPMLLACVAETLVVGGTASKLRAQAVALDREALHREADRLRATGAIVEEEMCSGIPADELVALAARPGMRLVVVSSHGHRAPLRWLLGSVAEGTAESSPVPTMVVRDAAPFEAWLRGERALKVFVGIDLTPQSEAALRWIGDLRQVGQCEVTAAYVAWTPPPMPTEFAGVPELTRDFPENEEKITRALHDEIRATLGEGGAQMHVTAGSGRVDSLLVELATDAHADVIVVGSHQWHGLDRLWHQSVSRGILHHARMNVACVPRPVA